MKFFNVCWFIVVQFTLINSEETGNEENVDFDQTLFECPEDELCWPKCCKDGEIFDVDNQRCSENTNNTVGQMSVYELSLNGTKLSLLKDRNATAIPNYGQFLHHELCNNSMTEIDHHEILFLSDGRMYVDKDLTVDIYETGFCIELFVDHANNFSSMSAFVCSGLSPAITIKPPNDIEQEVNTCSREFDMVKFYRTLRIVYTITGLFSLFFLGLTIFLYMTLPSLNNFHCKLMSLNLLFIFLTTFLLILQFNIQPASRQHLNQEEFFLHTPLSLCAFFGYLLFFTGVSKFFLMTVVCFDLYWMFSHLKKPEPIKVCGTRSLCYLTVGLVVPLLMTILTVLVDILRPFKHSPDVGSESCFLAVKSAKVKLFMFDVLEKIFFYVGIFYF